MTRKARVVRFLAITIVGIAAATGQAPLGWVWLSVPALAVWFHLQCRTTGAKHAFWTGWNFGLGYFGAALCWIVEPFFVDIARHGWMAPFALAAMGGGFALFYGAASAVAHRLAPGRGWLTALAWVFAVGLVESIRSYLFTGFPWALPGHIWVGWAPMHLAAFVGPIGLTVLTMLLASMPLAAFHSRSGAAGSAGVLVIFAAVFLSGHLLSNGPIVETEDRPIVRLIQPNAPQHLKWHPDHAPGFFRRQLQFTAAADTARPDLIIWPETSVPNLLHRADVELGLIAGAAGGVPVVLGMQRVEEKRAYNSLVVLGADGQVVDVYDKHHLVPFGEYMPGGNLLARIGIRAFAAQEGAGYSAGPGPRTLGLGAVGTALPLICYEAIFPQDVASPDDRPDWLLQITNDAWFGDLIGPYQHLAQARLRAVEQGLPMVRVANTGVSAVIDGRGKVLASIALGQAGWTDAELPPALPATLYSRSGDVPVILVLLGLFAVLVVARSRLPH